MIDLGPSGSAHQRPDNMLPAINVIFLLLLFFMVAGSIRERIASDVSPPASVSAVDLQAVADEFVLIPRGDLQLAGRSVTVPEWRAQLARDGTPVPAAVRLRADAGEPAGRIVALLDAFRDVGVARVSLVTTVVSEPATNGVP